MHPKPISARQLKHHWEIYLLVIPSALLIAIFQYYPALSGVYHSFFRWNGADISEWLGWRNYRDLMRSSDFWNSFRLALFLGAWNVVKMIPVLAVAVCIHRVKSPRLQFFYRAAFVIPIVIPGLVFALIWRSFFFEATNGYLNWFIESTGIFSVLCTLDRWLGWGGVFLAGAKPAWLGDSRLVISAMIILGFPWVSSFAVLAHSAKLQTIPKEQYEAGAIEGVTWWTRFTKIELPALSGSIYILIVFIIIDTLRDASTVLALVGNFNGGPGGVATVPALFMLRKAFVEQDMGFACAIGIVLAIIVIGLQKACTALMNWETQTPREKAAVKLFALALGLTLLAAQQMMLLGLGLVLVALPWPWLIARLPADRQAKIRALTARFRARPDAPDPNAPRGPIRAFPTPPPLPPDPKWKDPLLETAKHAYILFILAFAFLPLYLMLLVSVKTNVQFFSAPGTLTTPVHWENFTTAWRMVRPTLANSLFITISSTAVTLWIGLWAAYFFARVRVPGTALLWNAVLILMTLPTVANLIPLFRLLGDLQMLNTLTALIVVSASAGQVFAIFVLRNFIADIHQEIFDAAEVDGASHFEQVRAIVLPQAGAILGTVGVTHFVGQWNEFLLPLIVMRDHGRLPVTVELLRMSGEYIKLWGPLMAGYALTCIPVIVLFLFTMRYFMRGQADGLH